MVALAALIFALTIALALAQPTVGRLRIPHPAAALLGAALCLATGIVTPADALETLGRLALPLVTIVSLMVITIVAEHAGLLRSMASGMARAAGGSGRRLLVLVFACGALTGTVFTNDAAVLIFTPLVFALVEEVGDEEWTLANKMPFYFAVLYVGNLVGPLVISNPINIIVAGFFDIGFVRYACWMLLPSIVSMAVSLAGLWIFFADVIPQRCRNPRIEVNLDRRLARPCMWLLGMNLLGFFSESWTGVPVWAVALVGALTLLAIATALRYSPREILAGVGWDVLIFVAGIFVVVRGLRNVGLTGLLGETIEALVGQGLASMSMVTGLVAGACSSLMNNHPTAGLMTWVIQDFGLPAFDTEILVYSALIGGDLGPKMLPLGSLAALLWFRILRSRGVVVPYRLYVNIGVPVTIAAIVASILALTLEVWLAGAIAWAH